MSFVLPFLGSAAATTAATSTAVAGLSTGTAVAGLSAGTAAAGLSAGAAAAGGMSALGWAALGLQVAGAVMSANSAYDIAKGESAMAKYNAAVQRNNAKLAEEQAKQALIVGQREEFTARLKQAALRSHTRASYAERGLDLSEGTPLNALETIDYIGDIDALTIRDNANRTAWAHRVSAANARDEAGMLEARAGGVSPSSAAASTLLTGATKVAGSWYQFSKAGVL